MTIRLGVTARRVGLKQPPECVRLHDKQVLEARLPLGRRGGNTARLLIDSTELRSAHGEAGDHLEEGGAERSRQRRCRTPGRGWRGGTKGLQKRAHRQVEQGRHVHGRVADLALGRGGEEVQVALGRQVRHDSIDARPAHEEQPGRNDLTASRLTDLVGRVLRPIRD